MDLRILIPVLVVVAVIIVAVVLYSRKRRSQQLKQRFGPEYDRVVQQQRDPGRAETVLEQRAKRVERFEIRALADATRNRYAEEWLLVQKRFVDDPRASVTEADRLVTDVMSERGYPMGDFAQRADDVSVHYPGVVQNYRSAHDIALRDSRGQASTEDLRKAMVHYRSLFEELLAAPKPQKREVA